MSGAIRRGADDLPELVDGIPDPRTPHQQDRVGIRACPVCRTVPTEPHHLAPVVDPVRHTTRLPVGASYRLRRGRRARPVHAQGRIAALDERLTHDGTGVVYVEGPPARREDH